MGLLETIWNRNKELNFLLDFDVISDLSKKFHVKQFALEICVGLIARTIAQSDFRIKNGTNIVRDSLSYRLNVRPNLNTSASQFWEQVVRKLIIENEALIIKTDTDDLLLADTFYKNEYAIFEDTFRDVTVRGYTFQRVYKISEVLYFQYSNERLSSLVESLYDDYGTLFSRVLEFQKRKGQLRGIVDIDMINEKTEAGQKKLQEYIDKIYKSFSEKSIAVIPQQRGFNYKEMQSDASAPGVEELNKITDGFLFQVARALSIPIALLRGDMSDVENPTRNFMRFCIDSFLRKLSDEMNAKLFTREEYLSGRRLEIKRISYNNIFDVANAVDKLRASGVFNGNELREELGAERIDEDMLDQFFITRNYQELSDALKGGDNNNEA